MKILLDAIPLTEIVTGIQRYVRCLYSELESLPDVSVTYCTRAGGSAQMPRAADPDAWSSRIGMIGKLSDPVIVGSRIADRVLFELRLRQTNRRGPCDVCHEPSFFPRSTCCSWGHSSPARTCNC